MDFSLEVSAVDACMGEATGEASVIVTGGISPFTYDWSHDGADDPDDDSETITGLSAGDYTVTVTDGNGASKSVQVTVGEQECKNCNCTNFLYVNDPTFDLTHKFTLNEDGSVGTEIMHGTDTWVASETINNPHGVAPDINGRLYIAQIDQPGDASTNNLYKLDCDGNVISSDFIPGWEQTFNILTIGNTLYYTCLLYTSPSPRDATLSRMPSSA